MSLCTVLALAIPMGGGPDVRVRPRCSCTAALRVRVELRPVRAVTAARALHRTAPARLDIDAARGLGGNLGGRGGLDLDRLRGW